MARGSAAVIQSSTGVFLSYASEDAVAAQRICNALRNAGIEVWFDQSELRGGDAWDQQIRQQIRDCGLFVALVSANTNSRSEGYFRLEWRLAVERSHLMADDQPFLLPLVIDATPEELARVPDRFRERQWMRLRDDQVPADLVDHILRLLAGGPEQPATAYTPALASRAQSLPAQSSTARLGVCVLPFTNISGDPEQEYFSDGITEDVITDLSKVSALWVAARNTSFTFKGKHVDVLTVARQLNASHVLEGSVRKSGQRVRITAQLIDGASGGHVWAERFDRDLNDIFALQDQISQAIVAALKLRLLPEEKQAIEHRDTTNPQAYKLYLMARQLRLVGNVGAARTGDAIVRLCQRATELDPRYARAWALLGWAQWLIRLMQGRDSDGGAAAAERALALDPNLAEAHAARACVLISSGRLDEASAEGRLALQLDPESYEANYAAARSCLAKRDYPGAIVHFEKAASLVETDYVAAGMLPGCYAANGDVQGAQTAARRALARCEQAVAIEVDNGSAMGFLVTSLATLGEVERMHEWIERATLLDPNNLNMQYNIACMLITSLHDLDGGLRLLGPLFKVFLADSLNWIRTDPDMDPIRDDPRFQTLFTAAEARLVAHNA
jgi:adenylate cyclase